LLSYESGLRTQNKLQGKGYGIKHGLRKTTNTILPCRRNVGKEPSVLYLKVMEVSVLAVGKITSVS
jgi:hypothetical protein